MRLENVYRSYSIIDSLRVLRKFVAQFGRLHYGITFAYEKNLFSLRYYLVIWNQFSNEYDQEIMTKSRKECSANSIQIFNQQKNTYQTSLDSEV